MATIRGRRILWPRSSAPPPPPPPLQQPQPSRAPAVPNSRFVEGSMSDRASAAPPPSFLGPAEMAAYERQFYDADRPRPLRPVSSTGHYSHQEREHVQNPLAHSRSQQQPPPPRKAGFWDGMRERFFLTRSKSSSIVDHPGGGVAAAIANPLIAPPPPPPGPPTGGYPTRDQVLANYQTLVSSGFFESHAIHGTRHPPPPSMMGPPPAPPRPVSTPVVLPLPSPQRGTKRGTPADDNDTGGGGGARKLVKKLRRSASRISVDLAVSFGKPNPPRPSTSSKAASFVSSAASSIYEHPEPEPKTTPAPKKKLTKPQPPMTAVTRRGGWRDRSRSRSRSRARPAMPPPNPNPLAMNPVVAVVDQQILHIPLVDDAMLLDQEMATPRPSTDTLSGRGTVLHPPPSRGRATERRTSPKKGGQGPLSVVPDVNRGIPGVPRIPEGLKAFGGLSPAKEGGVFGFPAKDRRGREREREERHEGKREEDVKMGGRDSGLGEEVDMDENRGVGVGW
ncbi:hypothetical protein B0T18DRAFT_393061 [Schizothecium vesticola]|uniref:Uncharacterized protein n=1 Tax=Schizothecium vesticola TaxID=314040 RepID=A0AA40EIY4_9PEZI|nr:hypothetical protein B0T18DRAFT_393061 [Schizothecium vesticola]